MNSQIAHASALAPAAGGGRVGARGDRIPVVSTAVFFTLAAAAAVGSDLSTPLIDISTYVGATFVVLIVVLVAFHFRSGARAHEARMAALALPAALCAWAVFNHYQGPAGQPPSGVLAKAFPALERVQARRLPVRSDVRSALFLEAALKTGDEATKSAAVAAIARVPQVPVQRYLYGTAVSFGDATQKQRVLAALLTRQAGRALSVQLQGDDNLTLQSQYLEGSSIRFDASDGRPDGLRARLTTNKEVVNLRGALAGPALTVTGKATPADTDTAIALDASLGPRLTLSGDFRFSKGASVPFVVQAF